MAQLVIYPLVRRLAPCGSDEYKHGGILRAFYPWLDGMYLHPLYHSKHRNDDNDGNKMEIIG